MTECCLNRPNTWINPPLIRAYTAWAAAKSDTYKPYCLSVFQDGIRIGGIYGVHMGGVFAAESMFSRVSNASSVALAVLTAGLWRAGVELIDVQFRNAHTDQFGTTEITHAEYVDALTRLKTKQVELRQDYFCLDATISLTQSLSQTS